MNQYDLFGQQAPTYDDDGNLLNDVTKALAYNAENQVVSVTVPGVSVSTYEHDYLGRRVRKSVDVIDASGPDYSVTWVYSGWNKVQETKATAGGTTTTKNLVWGLDLSQSMEGAGGIGGLLAVVDGGGAKLFSYDGNGNVSELIASDSGNVGAHYEYSAFGETVLESGGLASENKWRFSTKQLDLESGLYDFGYRLYSPDLGRWMQRDPAEEEGGKNLYGFTGNEPTNAVDVLGLDTYLLFVGGEEGVPFTEAAEAQKNHIENSSAFRKSCDEVKIVQVRTFEDIQKGLKASKDIVQIWIYAHSGTGILYLDMRSREANSNITLEGGKQTVRSLFGLLGE